MRIEIISNNSEAGDLLEIGSRFFPRCTMVGEKISISKKIKGTHHVGVARREIATRKVIKLFEMFPEAKNVQKAMLTESIYFELNDVKIRLSAHPKKSFEGIDVLVKWNSNIEELKELILLRVAEMSL